MIPVVTTEEMARIEQLGGTAESLMLQAGLQVMTAAQEILQTTGGKRVVLLIGKGNKGGDAFVAGIRLLQAGYNVRAICFHQPSDCSPLNQKFAQQFSGPLDSTTDFSADDLIIDGLFGTGFHGNLTAAAEGQAIDLANQSGKPILAIDLPSGLDGTTGKSGGPIIHATETITLGFPKIGLFSKTGWEHTGKLHIADIGLCSLPAKAVAWIPQLEELKLPPMHRSQHKYERGLVVGLGGSEAYKGAVKLSGTAALHAGAGIVKLFTLDDVGPMADELIAQIWNPDLWKEAQAKASSYFVGPGLGRTKAAKEACKTALHSLDKPSVLDGDALYFLPELPMPSQCLLTPHQGEMLHLLGASHLEEAELWNRCQNYVEKHRVVLILKGAPTRIFSSNSVPILIPRGDPGMATAGSGDVLTGILAALLAQGQSLLEAAILGVTLHALAGEAAAVAKTSYGYTASDLIDYLPSAFKQISGTA